MKKILLILCLGQLFFQFAARAQDNCTVVNDVFQAGERLQYQLFYNVSFVWLQAGTAELNVRSVTYNGKPAFQLSAYGQTFKSFDPFYRVRDTLISYVDNTTLNPIRSYKFTHEDNWHGIDDFSFNKANDGWKITTRLMRKKLWKPSEVDLSLKCGFDILTSIYRLRCLVRPESFIIGKRIELPVRMDDGEYNVYLTYNGRERIKLRNVGNYNAHLFTITLVEGNVFKRGDVLKLWVSDDNNRIPLLMQSPIKLGYVKAIFKSAVKTKYPLQKPIDD